MHHYVDFNMAVEPYALAHAMNRTFTRIHGIIMGFGDSLATAWPQWTPEHPGRLIRVFGTRAQLQVLVDNPGIQFLIKSRLANTIGVLNVPSDVSEFRLYKRGYASERSFGRRLEKQVTRIKNHFVTTHGRSMTEKEEAALRARLRKSGRAMTPYIQVTSGSNGQSYRLFIQCENVDKVPGQPSFTHYGLGRTAIEALPHF